MWLKDEKTEKRKQTKKSVFSISENDVNREKNSNVPLDIWAKRFVPRGFFCSLLFYLFYQ